VGFLNHRERFLKTFLFEDVDRVPDYEFGYWTETIDRWHAEGLPFDQRDNRDVEIYLGLEGWDSLDWLPVRTGLWPSLPGRIIQQTADRIIAEDGMGGIYEQRTSHSTVPHYLRHPLRSPEDWDKLRPFFDPNTPGRFPLNWEEVVEAYKERDYPLGISIGSLYGWLRNWMGVSSISIALYRNPEWVDEMMRTLTELWLKVVGKALQDVKPDFATWWEDMCYNRGPMISVRHFEEFMVPRYKQVTALLKEHGVTINVLDCDGRINELVPGWLKGGINCMFPLEAAHTDAYELRQRFGKDLLLLGAVDKRALMRGPAAIDAELRRLTPLLKEGGHIPTVDHRVPPEVSLADYRYYLRKKREWIGRAT